MQDKVMCLDLYTGEVVEREFATQRFPNIPMKEASDPRSITETAYTPPNKIIMDAMMAGVALQKARKERFDSRDLEIPDEVDDIPLDPLRDPGIDFVDIQRTVQRADAALEAALQAKIEADRLAAEHAKEKEKQDVK